jgi:hypothetical protein
MHDHLDNRLTAVRAAGAALAGALALLCLLAAAPARAAVPPNDDFVAAETLTGASGAVGGSNVGATREAGEPTHAASGGASVWYRWTAPFSGRVEFDTCDGRSFDTTLAIYAGTALGGLQRLAANDDACDLGSRVRTNVAAGTTYHVAVDGFDGETGPFRLRWSLQPSPPPPANDDFAAGRVLTGVRGRLAGTTIGAGAQPGEPVSLFASSVWYRWRAPRTMPIVFSTCGAPFDTVLGVWRGPAVGSLRRLVWNDDACGLSSRVTLQAQRGQLYHVGVGALDEPGPFELRWQPAPCRVPSLRGRMLAQARTMLTRAGCSLGLVRYVPSTIAPRGAVVAQWPAAGTQLAHNARVRVAVSTGRPR